MKNQYFISYYIFSNTIFFIIINYYSKIKLNIKNNISRKKILITKEYIKEIYTL